MDIILHSVASVAPTFRLKDSFLEPYYRQGDMFPNLLARATYLSKYCRDNEGWTNTIRRSVEGSMSMVHNPIQEEAEQLFDLFWTGQDLPPGRGLWTGGVPGIPADAAYNCYYSLIQGIDDWCWVMNQLMLGGGVGVGLSRLSQLPEVAGNPCRMAVWCSEGHPNHNEVSPEGKSWLNGSTPVFVCQDTREGWVESTRRVMTAAWTGHDLIVDVSEVRERGKRLKTFGGVACGPGPLADLLRRVWTVIRGAAGRKLSNVEGLDITNHIGFCVKSGNIRRSALLVLGDPTDQAFRDAKKDWEAVKSHRHTSNNSLAFEDQHTIDTFDYHGLVTDNIEFGEPGLLNLVKVRQTDPEACGVNPCGEQILQDREACNLCEIYPGNFNARTDPHHALRLLMRYAIRQRLSPMTDARADAIRRKNMRTGVGLGGICDFDWTPRLLSDWYRVVRLEANEYADSLGINRPNFITTVKPSGTTSILCGSSPGIHAPYAPYYIRRTRHAVNDPLVTALIQAGVPFEYDVYDSKGNTVVFEFPMKAKHTRTTVQSEKIRDQFERQAVIQKYWADNAVSSTLSFDPLTERQETGELLREFVPQFKSTSLLAKSGHGYAQAPYEEISETEYRTRCAGINLEAKLVQGDLEDMECAGGVCPVRLQVRTGVSPGVDPCLETYYRDSSKVPDHEYQHRLRNLVLEEQDRHADRTDQIQPPRYQVGYGLEDLTSWTQSLASKGCLPGTPLLVREAVLGVELTLEYRDGVLIQARIPHGYHALPVSLNRVTHVPTRLVKSWSGTVTAVVSPWCRLPERNEKISAYAMVFRLLLRGSTTPGELTLYGLEAGVEGSASEKIQWLEDQGFRLTKAFLSAVSPGVVTPHDIWMQYQTLQGGTSVPVVQGLTVEVNTTAHPYDGLYLPLLPVVKPSKIVGVTWNLSESGRVQPVVTLTPVSFFHHRTFQEVSLPDRGPWPGMGKVDVVRHLYQDALVLPGPGNGWVLAAPVNCPNCSGLLTDNLCVPCHRAQVRSRLQGTGFQFAGVFSRTHTELKEDVESAGGSVVSTINRAKDYLVWDQVSTAAKVERARRDGVRILTWESFQHLLGVDEPYA